MKIKSIILEMSGTVATLVFSNFELYFAFVNSGSIFEKTILEVRELNPCLFETIDISSQ